MQLAQSSPNTDSSCGNGNKLVVVWAFPRDHMCLLALGPRQQLIHTVNEKHRGAKPSALSLRIPARINTACAYLSLRDAATCAPWSSVYDQSGAVDFLASTQRLPL